MQPYSYFVKRGFFILGNHCNKDMFRDYYEMFSIIFFDLLWLIFFITAPVSVPLIAWINWYGQPRGDDYDA